MQVAAHKCQEIPLATWMFPECCAELNGFSLLSDPHIQRDSLIDKYIQGADSSGQWTIKDGKTTVPE